MTGTESNFALMLPSRRRENFIISGKYAISEGKQRNDAGEMGRGKISLPLEKQTID